MKIIDLLNKMANGEEVPKKIAIQNEVLIYNEDEILNLQDCYYMNDDEDATWKIWAYELNDEVEILDDEEKGLPKKITMRAALVGDIDNKIESLDINIMAVEDKLNEIIDYLEKQRKGDE